METLVTIILGILSYLFLIRTEIPAKIFLRNVESKEFKQGIKDIRNTLGILIFISFLFFLVKIL